MPFRQRNSNRCHFSAGQMERMKRLAVWVALLLTMAGLLLSRISDAGVPIADTLIPDSEVSGGIDKSANIHSSANAIITITMRTDSFRRITRWLRGAGAMTTG